MHAHDESTAQPLRFPDSFLFGTATASAQVEGGLTDHSWYRWSEAGKIKDGSHCRRACDHWNRVTEDIALQRELHQQTHRLSLEWSRIEPDEGRADAAALEHYRDELQQLLTAGIRPLVTLHHFSNPAWFDAQGGWTNSDAPEAFNRYAAIVVDALGDIVSDWVTINEPSVYLLFGHVFGIWPPGRTSMADYFAGARTMIRAHLAAYRTIHRSRARRGYTDTAVGAAHHLRLYDPAGGPLGRTASRAVCALYYRVTQDIFLEGMLRGRFSFPLGGRATPGARLDARPTGAPGAQPGTRPTEASRSHQSRDPALPAHGLWSDFLGINYYTRDHVHFTPNPGMLFGRLGVEPGAATNDLGWELYPEGLARLVRRYAPRYPLPIFITENGTADARDAFRARYLYDHLRVLHQLIQEGFDLQRYYHWTLMDNFEWIEGEAARFGLIEVDFETQRRTVRPSGRYYATIARDRVLTRP